MDRGLNDQYSMGEFPDTVPPASDPEHEGDADADADAPVPSEADAEHDST